MPIPSTDQFESFFESIEFVTDPKAAGDKRVLALTETPFHTASGRQFLTPFWFVAFNDSLRIESVIGRVAEELRFVGHASSERVALVTVALSSLITTEGKSRLEKLNEVTARLHRTDLTQIAVTGMEAGSSRRVKLEPFTFGRFRDNIMHRIEVAARSGIADQSRVESLREKFAIEREIRQIRTVAWDEVVDPNLLSRLQGTQHVDRGRVLSSPGKQYWDFVDEYYQAISAEFLEVFVEEIRQAQLLIEAADVYHLDEHHYVNDPRTDRISVFVWRTQRTRTGWVVVNSQSRSFELYSTEMMLSSIEEGKELTGQSLSTSRPLDATIRAFCEPLQRARRLDREGLYHESFLHFVIAIEVLLGSTGQIVKTLSERAASITHRIAGCTFEEQVRRVQELYDTRSRYVHDGQAIGADALAEVKSIATEILQSLLRLRSSGGIDKIRNWLAKLDLVAASYRAGEEPSTDLLEACGIVDGRDPV